VPLELVITAEGKAELQPAGSGITPALGHIVAAIPAAVADGTWARMKVCPSDVCLAAFFDRSKNRSRRWCAMEVCGNREKTQAFRERQREG
jgi:predicted RNA-binding Zn ribbon-like protein